MNMEIPRVLKNQFIVRSFDVGVSSTLTAAALCRYLQEAAGLHARLLNVSTEQLQAVGKTWVLRELAIKIDLSSQWREVIEIVTWPTTASQGARAYRDFRIFDAGQNLIGSASSMWLMLDRNTLKPLKIPSEILALGSAPIEEELFSDTSLESFEQSNAQITKTFPVRLSDLDLNRHVNNVSYVQLALEAISEERFNKSRLTGLQIKYLAEAKFNDTIVSQSKAHGEIVDHQLLIESDGRAAALMRSTWSPS